MGTFHHEAGLAAFCSNRLLQIGPREDAEKAPPAACLHHFQDAEDKHLSGGEQVVIGVSEQ